MFLALQERFFKPRKIAKVSAERSKKSGKKRESFADKKWLKEESFCTWVQPLTARG
jgi:hypothetical protein